MCDKKSSSGLIAGLTIGAVVGAGAAILFGTKKGKELQIKIKKQYPEVFDKIDEKLEEVKEEVQKEIKQIKQIGAPKKRFVKNGRKL